MNLRRPQLVPKWNKFKMRADAEIRGAADVALGGV